MSTSFEDLRDNYTQLWSTMQERPEWTDRITRAAAGILSSKEDYKLVEDMTGVPWFVVGILHQMESTRNFKTHLHNGDSLTDYTVNVPAGRPLTGILHLPGLKARLTPSVMQSSIIRRCCQWRRWLMHLKAIMDFVHERSIISTHPISGAAPSITQKENLFAIIYGTTKRLARRSVQCLFCGV